MTHTSLSMPELARRGSTAAQPASMATAHHDLALSPLDALRSCAFLRMLCLLPALLTDLWVPSFRECAHPHCWYSGAVWPKVPYLGGVGCVAQFEWFSCATKLSIVRSLEWDVVVGKWGQQGRGGWSRVELGVSGEECFLLGCYLVVVMMVECGVIWRRSRWWGRGGGEEGEDLVVVLERVLEGEFFLVFMLYVCRWWCDLDVWGVGVG